MKITRFQATEDGGSRFVEIDIPIAHDRKDAEGNILKLSNSYISPSVLFAELPNGMVQDWHNAPARQIVVVLSGELEVGTYLTAACQQTGPARCRTVRAAANRVMVPCILLRSR